MHVDVVGESLINNNSHNAILLFTDTDINDDDNSFDKNHCSWPSHPDPEH